MVAITLKSIKHTAAASEETHFYSADLYVDGVKWGVVGNAGHGGSDYFYPVPGRRYEDLPALDAQIKASYPPVPSCFDGGEPLDATLEMVCCDLVNDFLVGRDLSRLLRKSLVFFAAPLSADGAKAPLYSYALKGATVERVSTYCRSTYPDAFILNALPFEEAVAAYRRAQ